MKSFLLLSIQKMKCFFYFCIIYTFLWTSSGIVYANQEKKKILSLLEGRHWSLNTKEFLRTGDDTDSLLIEIAGDSKIINYLRFRATEALSLFPSEKTAKYLEITSEKSFPSLARRSFEAFRNGFSKTQAKRVKKLATRLLKHSNSRVRIVAARTMRSMDKTKFEVFLKSEKNSWVRKEAKK